MAQSTSEYRRQQLETPTGQALQRILKEPSFAEAVAADPASALAEYDLDAESIEALAADAESVSADVEGFASKGFDQKREFVEVRTLGKLGLEPLRTASLCATEGRRVVCWNEDGD